MAENFLVAYGEAFLPIATCCSGVNLPYFPSFWLPYVARMLPTSIHHTSRSLVIAAGLTDTDRGSTGVWKVAQRLEMLVERHCLITASTC